MIHVVKIGGNVLDNPPLLQNFVKEFATLPHPKILIHGGGVMASRMQQDLGMRPLMVGGRRVTDESSLRVVTMVYAGWGNKHLTALLQAAGCDAIGLSGCDADLIRAERRPPLCVENRMVDFGFVGDVRADSIHASRLLRFFEMGLTPVFSAINHDGRGNLLNTNADTVATALATALSGTVDTRLTFCFEKPGVLLDPDDDDSLISRLSAARYAVLKAGGGIGGGMVPKLDNAFAAVAAGVSRVEIKHAAHLLHAHGTLLTS